MTPKDTPQELTLRRGVIADLAEIMAIERASFPTPWSQESMERELSSQNGSVYYVVEVEGRVAGYAGAWMYSGEAHVLTIAVREDQRGEGFGELLMLAVLEHAWRRGCDRCVLEYRVSNTRAEALYRKLGFEAVAIRPGYYTDTDEDAVCALISDLDSPARQEKLAELRRQWETRHAWTARSED